MARILVINGPNINILGRRNPGIYGSKTLEQVNQEISKKADALRVDVVFYQSNVEGEIINRIQESWGFEPTFDVVGGVRQVEEFLNRKDADASAMKYHNDRALQDRLREMAD